MRFFTYILLLISFALVSCDKDEYTEGHSIIETAKSKPTDMQDLVKARLLFAKIVSIAFGNREFRAYFKTNFGTISNKGNYFEECLLINHLDDQVLADGTTLRTFLNSITDCEVSNIITGNIVDHVLNVDQLVAIKLPDAFLKHAWNIDEVLPVVIATYPEEFSNVNYIGYHHCNDSEFYTTGNIPQVFHVYIKHSEDYILVDESNITDLYEHLPQAEICAGLVSRILNESGIFQDKYVVNIKDAYSAWHEGCSFKENYMEVNGCEEICQRNCSNPSNYNFVLDHLTVTEPIFYLANTALAFRESGTVYIQSHDLDKQLIFGDFAVPNIRFSEMGRSFTTISHTDKLGKIPRMTIEEVVKPNEIPVKIKYLVTNVPHVNLNYNITLLQYGDVYFRRKIIDPNFENPFDAENAYLLESNVLSECINADTNTFNGSISLNFRY